MIKRKLSVIDACKVMSADRSKKKELTELFRNIQCVGAEVYQCDGIDDQVEVNRAIIHVGHGVLHTSAAIVLPYSPDGHTIRGLTIRGRL